MGEDLRSMVKKFLDSSGYPLEMQVARQFKRNGFAVEQARTYVDTKTEALREVDVVAFSSRETILHPGRGWAQLRLIVECKHSNKPWLMFAGDTKFRISREHFDALDIVEFEGGKLKEAWSEGEMPIISHVGEMAYRVGTVGPRDDAFAAVQQVNGAVLGIKRDLALPELHQGEPAVVALVPVVVIDSPLFSCRLDSTGEVVLTAVDKGLLLTRLRAEVRLQSVWIVTAEAFNEFVRLARTTVDNMTIDRRPT